MIVGKLKRLYRYLFKNPPKVRVTFNAKSERHGHDYGGWNILTDSLDAHSIVYSFGIGNDISFDLSLIKKYGCKVQAFDPTPRVADWLQTQNIDKRFIFHPIGLSNYDGMLTFYTPTDEQHISHKAYPAPSSKALEVQCQKLGTIQKNMGNSVVDLLKIDIEGFEYSVLENIVAENIRPKQLLVEFHHFFPEVGNAKTEETILFLEKNGYRLFNIADSFCEYSFVDITK